MRKLFSALVLVVFSLSMAYGQLANSAWPMFRGDLQHTGRSQYNGPTTPTLKLSFQNVGPITSNPVIGTDGTIYEGSTDGNLYAQNIDGTQKWKFKTQGIISSSPTISTDGTIYIGSQDKSIYALRADGTQKWSLPIGDKITSSPVIGSDGTIYVGSQDKNLYAIKPDGNQKWMFSTGGEINSSPAISSDGNTIYFGSDDNKLYALGIDGVKKWESTTIPGAISSSPAIDTDGTIYVGCDDKKLYAIAQDGTQKWAFTTGNAIKSSPAIGTDGTIYIGSDKVYAINSDGSQKWAATGGGNSSPTIGKDGTIYIGSYAINSDGSQKWVYGTNVTSSPTIAADGTLYIGSDVIGATVTITSPKGGEQWQQGSLHPITWTSTEKNMTVKIELFKGGISNSTIIDTTLNNGIYNWRIPVGQVVGTDYKVKISMVGDTRVMSQNVTDIAITAGSPLALTSPNGNEQWQLGNPHQITWTSIGLTGNVKIELLKGGVSNITIADNLANTSPYSWTIPASQVAGTDYKIKISSVADTKIYSQSNADFVITTGSSNSTNAWSMYRHDIQHTGRSQVAGPSTNTLKWTSTIGAASSSPSIGKDGTIFVGAKDGYLYAINPNDGSEKWKFKIGSSSVTSSPAIATDGTIYVGSVDNNIFAINPDGTQKWSFPTGGAINSSPTIGSDGTIYIGSNDKNLYAITPDGNFKWSFPTGDSPAISADGTTLYTGSSANLLYALNIDGTVKWKYTTVIGTNTFNPAVGIDGTIYFGTSDSKVYAIKPDGTHIWAYTTAGKVSSGPSIGADNNIYVGSVDNNLYAINNSDGLRKWSFKTTTSVTSNPAVGADGVIYIGSNDIVYGNRTYYPYQKYLIAVNNNIYAINPVDGTEKWKFTSSKDESSHPAIGADGTLYCGTNAIGSSIIITSPNGGEQWQQGSLYPITWTSTAKNINMKIELFKGGILNSLIIATTPNNSLYNWTIPASQAIATDYKVKISIVEDARISSQSATNFSITNDVTKPFIYLSSPVGGEFWKQWSSQLITWKLGNVTGNVKIELLKNGILNSIIADSAPNNSSFNWTIPGTQLVGTDYKIRISSLTDGSLTSQSTTNFAITTGSAPLATIKVTAPNGNEQWQLGSSQTITWTSTGNPGNVKIELLNGIAVDSAITASIANTTGSYSWTVPANTTAGTAYKVRISSLTDPNITDISDANFTITTIPSLTTPVQVSPKNNASKVTSPVTIVWQPVNTAVSYKYELYNSTTNNPIETNTVTTTSALITYTLTAGATYSWRVQATDANGLQSAFSPRWSFTSLTLPILGTPILTFPLNNAIDIITSPTLIWRSGANATVYSVEVATDATFNNTIVNQQDVTATSYSVSNLTNNTKYYWRVKGGDGTRWGTAVTANFTTTTIVIPRVATPVLTSPANGANDQSIAVTLTWQPVTVAVSYTLQYASNSSFNNATILTNTTTTANVTLLENSRYYWRVKATDNNGIESNWSSSWYFNTLIQAVQLDAPVLISPADGDIDVPIRTTFNWGSVAYAKAYDIEISKDLKFAIKAQLSTSATSMTISLANNVIYYWRVRGKNGNNLGTWSTVNTFTTVAFIQTNGIDAAIANSKVGNQLIGIGVINNNSNLQTVQIDNPINRQGEINIVIKNIGNVPDNFLISTLSTINTKWKVAIYDISGIDRTRKVFNEGWASYAVKPGENVIIRLRFAAASGQKVDDTNPQTQSISITAQSINDLNNGLTTPASDTVTGTAVLVRMSK